MPCCIKEAGLQFLNAIACGSLKRIAVWDQEDLDKSFPCLLNK